MSSESEYESDSYTNCSSEESIYITDEDESIYITDDETIYNSDNSEPICISDESSYESTTDDETNKDEPYLNIVQKKKKIKTRVSDSLEDFIESKLAIQEKNKETPH